MASIVAFMPEPQILLTDSTRRVRQPGADRRLSRRRLPEAGGRTQPMNTSSIASTGSAARDRAASIARAPS